MSEDRLPVDGASGLEAVAPTDPELVVRILGPPVHEVDDARWMPPTTQPREGRPEHRVLRHRRPATLDDRTWCSALSRRKIHGYGFTIRSWLQSLSAHAQPP